MNKHKKTIGKIVKNIKKYFAEACISSAVIGLSGGIDSAVACNLTTMALGKEKVIAVLMPEVGLTKEQNVQDAHELAEELGIRYIMQPINKMLAAYDFNVPVNDLARINLKARIRANILYSFANTFNALVIGTSNKSEIKIGYGTKYGDLACDLFVIGDLYKTELFEVAKELGIPERIINKIPSAELFDGQTDEKEIGVSYKVLDEQIKSRRLSRKIRERVEKNRHKGKFPTIIKSH